MQLDDQTEASLNNAYDLSDTDFAFIVSKSKTDFGLNLSNDKIALVQSRLTKRLRHLGLSDFSAYCSFLSTSDGQEESIQMLSALTTNVTHFFREKHHFDRLVADILPDLRIKAESGKRIRIWSAGCSAGQEPYSIAATILANWPSAPSFDVKILATDVDPEILAVASAGLYSDQDIEGVAVQYRDLLFETSPEGKHHIRQDVSSLIKFGNLNLISDWPMSGKFDVIFCRNVAIYFDKPTQVRLWERFYNILTPNGTLNIGHSERLSGDIAKKFESAGVTMYRRLAG